MKTDIALLYQSFQSTDVVQSKLFNCYNKKNIQQAEQKSYENVYSFIYFIEHGLTYYQSAQTAPLSIRPVLLFYGMIQLIKACLLTVDPLYPETTSVLAHGVSTRKRKKQGYSFLHDEVKIQKNGLFTHFSDKMFHVKQLEGAKYTMKQLLSSIPELELNFQYIEKTTPFYKIGTLNSEQYEIPATILDHYKMTQDRFVQYVEHNTPLKFKAGSEAEKIFIFTGEIRILNSAPLYINLSNESIYFPKNKEMLWELSDTVIHYLVLYNLSMVCRYETEWWGELIHTFHSSDLTYITNFLHITEEKIPYILYEFIKKQFDCD